MEEVLQFACDEMNKGLLEVEGRYNREKKSIQGKGELERLERLYKEDLYCIFDQYFEVFKEVKGLG